MALQHTTAGDGGEGRSGIAFSLSPLAQRKRGSQLGLAHNSGRQKNKVWHYLVLIPASVAHEHRQA
jgi:hypothetical protein